MKNKIPFFLCLIGGLLLIATHFTGGVSSILFLWLFLSGIPALASFLAVIWIILFFLFLIAWAGGLSVIIGGFLLTTSHVRLGKIIIAIAAGFGLISLVLIVIWVILTSGWIALLALSWMIVTTPWAFGIFLTILARTKAK
jgi:hypothetical protein